jgi:hypothetical protein
MMTKMKIFAAAGVSALMLSGVMATPSMAQPGRYYDRGAQDYDRGGRHYDRNLTSGYVDSLEWKINNAAQERRITWPQARQLRAELRRIQGPLVYRVETGQASRGEEQRLVATVSRIESAIQGYAHNGRNPRYGYSRY